MVKTNVAFWRAGFYPANQGFEQTGKISLEIMQIAEKHVE